MVIWSKIWRDLWENKARTFQAITVIAIGTLAIGAIWGGRQFITDDLATSWQASSPANIAWNVDPAVDQATLESLEKIEGIDVVQGEMSEPIKWRLDPNKPWQNTTLIGSDEFAERELRQWTLLEGSWPERDEVAVQSDRGVAVGDTIYLEINEKIYEIVVSGLVDDAASVPSLFNPNPNFYITDTRFEALLGEANFDTVYATITDY
ncbi:MAG: hypothetical protein KDF65_03090, partial [Anaerolineae bacterium]|nr:hypothetical protein [Anaerolineae bacterium]